MGFKKFLNTYQFECTLPGSGQVVKFKPLITKQMKKLSVHENEHNPIIIEEIFDDLISSCAVSEKFNIGDLFLQDRIFLLMEIRRKSKGDTYEFRFNCPECGKESFNTVNFDELKVIPIKDVETVGKIVISDDISIFIKHITRGEQKKGYAELKKLKNGAKQQTDMVMNSIAVGITKVQTPEGEEELSYEDKKYILDNLNFSVFDKVKEWYDKNDFGIQLSYTMCCNQPDCDFVSENQPIRIDSNFF